MTTGTITTARLCLRLWQDEDLSTFAALNANLRVMEHFPGTLSRTESNALVARIRDYFARHGSACGRWRYQAAPPSSASSA